MQLELAATHVNYLGGALLSITDAANHCPVFHEFMILPANVYDAMIAGNDFLDINATQIDGAAFSTHASGMVPSDLRDIAGATASTTTAQLGVNVIKIGGTTQTARDIGSSVLLSSGTGTGQVTLVNGTVTVGTNNDKSGYSLTVTPPTSGAIADAIWDEATAGHTSTGSIGKVLIDNIDTTISSRSTFSGGAVASVTGPVTVGTNSDKSGYALTVTPPTSGAIADAILDAASTGHTGAGSVGAKINALPSGIKKNTALANFMFPMFGSTTGLPTAGLTVTAQRSLDGAAFGACANPVSEVGSGIYTIDLAAADLNANVAALKFTAIGAIQKDYTIITES
jgi:hypothetical protein